jgi:HK97 family phage portal protein
MSFLGQLLFHAATPENPRFSLNDPSAWDALGAEPSSTGMIVNAETALRHAPWWRGVNLIANVAAKLPLTLNKIAADGKWAPDKKHDGYFLLRRKSNSRQTAGQFRRQLMGHALSRGNGYAAIVRDAAARPIELLPMDPDDTFPVLYNGRLWYVSRVKGGNAGPDTRPGPGGSERKLAAEDVLHIRGFSYDGLVGYNVVEKARESLGLGMGSKKFASVFFRNAARMAVILQHPSKLEEKAKKELRESFERMQTGLDNAHRTAILDGGLEAKQISFNAEDSQLLDTRKFDVREVANFLGLPVHKLGDMSGSAYNSLEEENQACLDDCYDPWLCNWEEECWDKLLTEQEKADESHEVTFDRGQLERADVATRAAANRVALSGRSWKTVNEARREDGLPPTDNPEDDEVQQPLNMGPGQGPPDGDEPPAKTPPKRKQLTAPSRNGNGAVHA